MSILSKEELKNLLKVKTNRAQARQILKRNKGILKFLEQLPVTQEEYDQYDGDGLYDGHVGCPHCYSYQCSNCSWQEFYEDRQACIGYRQACIYVPFGGIRYIDCEDISEIYLSYYQERESVRWDFTYNEEYPEELANLKTFIKGHIEWAKEILKKYGE